MGRWPRTGGLTVADGKYRALRTRRVAQQPTTPVGQDPGTPDAGDCPDSPADLPSSSGSRQIVSAVNSSADQHASAFADLDAGAYATTRRDDTDRRDRAAMVKEQFRSTRLREREVRHFAASVPCAGLS